MKYRTNSKQE